MDIPKLKKSSRSREFVSYSPSQRASVVQAYLFGGKSHRQIDEDVLHLDSTESRGYQSMGILHYLGLVNNFKAIFDYLSINEAIHELESSANDDYSQIIEILSILAD